MECNTILGGLKPAGNHIVQRYSTFSQNLRLKILCTLYSEKYSTTFYWKGV
jgi:hypothetical protein